MAEIFGYTAAVAVGLVLGLIGAGGAILTVPIMVYLMGVNPVMATAEYVAFVRTEFDRAIDVRANSVKRFDVVGLQQLSRGQLTDIFNQEGKHD